MGQVARSPPLRYSASSAVKKELTAEETEVRRETRVPVNIKVEFFGIPRKRAETPETWVRTDAREFCLGDLVSYLAEQYPGLARDCIIGRSLHPSCLANIQGERFVSAPDTPLAAGQVVLIMSSDGGG